MKRDLNDWSITTVLASDRREWKLAIMWQNLDIWFLHFYCLFIFSFLFIRLFHHCLSLFSAPVGFICSLTQLTCD
jgi:hypothetical protein